MPLLYHAYVYLEFLILACTIYILAPDDIKNTGGTLIGNMLKITKKLPRELKINEVLNEMKNNRGM